MTPAFQTAGFAAALLDAERAAPEGLAAARGGGAARFAIYRNNVMVGLVGALRARYPAIERLLGADYFTALAQLHVAAHPPRSPVLQAYGSGFADFIAAFPPLADYPYLADVARIEDARVRATHAADHPPFDPLGLGGLDDTAIAGARLGLHPSVAVIRSPYAAGRIWTLNAQDASAEATNSLEPDGADGEDWGPEDVLVARPGAHLVTQPIVARTADLIAALLAGATLGAALPDTGAAEALADILAFGLVTHLTLAEAP